MNYLQLFLGQIPEAIYLAIFLIYTKKLKEHRILFIILTVIEYLLLKYSFQYNWYFHIALIFVLFITLKVIYKEKSQITDIFIILISFMYLGITSAILYIIFSIFYPNMIVTVIIHKIILFVTVFSLNYKLNNIQQLYKKYWNRNNKPKKFKSVTFRSVNVVLFNIIFVILNACMLYAVFIHNIRR